mgnify:CR=1 FL=1
MSPRLKGRCVRGALRRGVLRARGDNLPPAPGTRAAVEDPTERREELSGKQLCGQPSHAAALRRVRVTAVTAQHFAPRGGRPAIIGTAINVTGISVTAINVSAINVTDIEEGARPAHQHRVVTRLPSDHYSVHAVGKQRLRRVAGRR